MAILDPRTGALLSDFAMQVAAAAANAHRNARFWQLVNGPYAGPRIVAEGDSWFCYPSELLLSAPDDLILQLGREFAVATEAVPGDLVAAMVDTLESPGGLLVRLDQFRADILLLSGGGNDLLGEGQLEALLSPGPKPILDDYFKTEAFRETFWSVLDDLETILRAALDSDSGLKAVIHGYDYAMPAADARKGPWLRAPMLRLGIPVAQQQAVVDRIVDWFNRAQIELAQRLNEEYGEPRVHHADLRNDALTAQWHDEIHPSTAGFATMARTMRRAIMKAFPLVA